MTEDKLGVCPSNNHEEEFHIEVEHDIALCERRFLLLFRAGVRMMQVSATL